MTFDFVLNQTIILHVKYYMYLLLPTIDNLKTFSRALIENRQSCQTLTETAILPKTGSGMQPNISREPPRWRWIDHIYLVILIFFPEYVTSEFRVAEHCLVQQVEIMGGHRVINIILQKQTMAEWWSTENKKNNILQSGFNKD